MKKLMFASLAVAAALAGCSDPVPKVADPKNIVVNGETMTQQAFLEKYCTGQTLHETCVKVSQAMVIESTKSKNGIPRF